MLPLNLPPTRAALLQVRRDLALAREGHDLLDLKRQTLIMQITELLADAEDAARRLDVHLMTAYKRLGEARMAMGVERVEWVALGAAAEARVGVTERSIMGVPVPMVRVRRPALHLTYSLSGTTSDIDRAVEAFAAALDLAGRAAELETAVWRLAGEIRKTQRRVNALANVLIPRLESDAKRIETALAEKEREDLYRTKAVKRLRRQQDVAEDSGI